MLLDDPVLPLRFWGKVVPEPNSGCWLWTNARTQDGYGVFGKTSAHRASYEKFIGEIPEGLELDHLCRTTACVRPDHLEPVTHLENMRRSAHAQRTHCKPGGHPYAGKNLYVDKHGRRHCRRCNTDAALRYKARKKDK